jgi:hypothetical protein
MVRLHDKSNNFVFLDNKLDADKVKEQMERGCFKNVGYDPPPETGLEIGQCINKWQPMGLSAKWIKFITNTNNTHPLFVEKYCKIALDSISCRVRDTTHMLDIVDELNLTGLSDEDLLVSFDITNMYPSIDNQTGIERVRCKLSQYAEAFDLPIECVIEAL